MSSSLHDTSTTVLLFSLSTGTLLSSYTHLPSSSSTPSPSAPPSSPSPSSPPFSLPNLASFFFALQKNASFASPSCPPPVLRSFRLPTGALAAFSSSLDVCVAVVKSGAEAGGDRTREASVGGHSEALADLIAADVSAGAAAAGKIGREDFERAAAALVDRAAGGELVKVRGATVFSGRCLLALLNLFKRGGYDMVRDTLLEDGDDGKGGGETALTSRRYQKGTGTTSGGPLGSPSSLSSTNATKSSSSSSSSSLFCCFGGNKIEPAAVVASPPPSPPPPPPPAWPEPGFTGEKQKQRKSKPLPPEIVTFRTAPSYQIPCSTSESLEPLQYLKDLVQNSDVMSTISRSSNFSASSSFSFCGKFHPPSGCSITMMDKEDNDCARFVYACNVMYIVPDHGWSTMHEDMAKKAFQDKLQHLSVFFSEFML